MTIDKKIPPYETPIIIPLGELARGSGKCSQGSNGKTSGYNCTNGNRAKATGPKPQFPPAYCSTGSGVR